MVNAAGSEEKTRPAVTCSSATRLVTMRPAAKRVASEKKARP